ncbi:SPW repeat protein [Salinifilum ghardaiensis]
MTGANGAGSRTARAQRWVRWQDWVAVLLGIVLVLTPLWTTTTAPALSASLILGILLILASLWSLADPRSMTSEYAHILLGVILFVAPWPLGYAAFSGVAWTSWVIGVLTVALGLAALPSITSAHQGR